MTHPGLSCQSDSPILHFFLQCNIKKKNAMKALFCFRPMIWFFFYRIRPNEIYGVESINDKLCNYIINLIIYFFSITLCQFFIIGECRTWIRFLGLFPTLPLSLSLSFSPFYWNQEPKLTFTEPLYD